MGRKSTYSPPLTTHKASLKQLIALRGTHELKEQQFDLLRSSGGPGGKDDVCVFYAGNLDLLVCRCVSIVGTREVSQAGWARAARLARELVQAGVAIVSGLARGVDTAALRSAIIHGGRTIAVIGTPLTKAYPSENSELQEEIYRRHLLLTPFDDNATVFKSNFPKRNRVMAALSDATVIIEASDTSGTLHQAAECQRLGRWLFISRSVAENPNLKWPASFLGGEKTRILYTTKDILEVL